MVIDEIKKVYNKADAFAISEVKEIYNSMIKNIKRAAFWGEKDVIFADSYISNHFNLDKMSYYTYFRILDAIINKLESDGFTVITRGGEDKEFQILVTGWDK